MARTDDGFTLIEVLVALAICTLALTLTMNAISSGWRGVRSANTEAQAMELARALVEQTASRLTRESGTVEGRSESGMEWTVAVERHAPAAFGAASSSLRAYWIDVAVSWRERAAGPRKRLRLTTVRLAGQP